MSDQGSLFGHAEVSRPWQTPDHVMRANQLARRDDPDTSHIAAAALSGRAGTIRRRLLRAYAAGIPLTSEGAAQLAGFTPADGAWKRVSDLKNVGLIEDSGQRVRSDTTGRMQVVWRITDAGRRIAGLWR